jgi:hypothetical protein
MSRLIAAGTPAASTPAGRSRVSMRSFIRGMIARVLFKRSQLDGIAAGAIDLQFRRWDRPRARAGSRQMTAVGVIRIDDVRVVRTISRSEAARAGFATPDEVVRALRPDGDLYRIALHFEGPDPRLALREQVAVGDDLEALRRKIERLPWALDYLRAIRDRPEVRAEELAASFGVEKRVFKPRVRRLKELGLTISLSPGYRLSPRGEAFLAAHDSFRNDEGPAEAGPSK